MQDGKVWLHALRLDALILLQSLLPVSLLNVLETSFPCLPALTWPTIRANGSHDVCCNASRWTGNQYIEMRQRCLRICCNPFIYC